MNLQRKWLCAALTMVGVLAVGCDQTNDPAPGAAAPPPAAETPQAGGVSETPRSGTGAAIRVGQETKRRAEEAHEKALKEVEKAP